MEVDLSPKKVEAGDRYYLEMWGKRREDGRRPRFVDLFVVTRISKGKVRIECDQEGYRGSYSIPKSLIRGKNPQTLTITITSPG